MEAWAAANRAQKAWILGWSYMTNIQVFRQLLAVPGFPINEAMPAFGFCGHMSFLLDAMPALRERLLHEVLPHMSAAGVAAVA